MRIALDATYSVGENLSGVGVYCRELLRELARLPEANRVRWLWCYRPHRLRAAFRESLPTPCARRPLFDAWSPAADLFHGLNQRLPRALPARAVVTFHDLFVITGDYSTPEFRRRFEQQAREAAARAHAIVTVSRFTADQVHALLGVERARLHPIPHGVRVPVVSSEATPREPVVLSVGAIQARKNTARLIRAFAAMPPGWKLVLAGSRGYASKDAMEAAESSPRRADILFTGWIDDRALADWYARASVFAFPSLDEGFGMPVLEAMAAGVPVIASNCSAMPEVAGDAALLVDPHREDAIADELRRLAGDEDLRSELAARGRHRASGFTWDRAAAQTFAVYESLLSRA